MSIKLICVIKCDLSDLDDLSDSGDMGDLCDPWFAWHLGLYKSSSNFLAFRLEWISQY